MLYSGKTVKCVSGAGRRQSIGQNRKLTRFGLWKASERFAFSQGQIWLSNDHSDPVIGKGHTSR